MMINKKTISLNIFFSLLQILITGLVYYFLYKFLLKTLGANLMGVWAIVLSISSTANIANLGIGSGVVRYTALFKASDDWNSINRLLHTSLILLAGFFVLIITCLYFIAPIWLNAVIDKTYYSEALSIVPYSLLCLLLNALSGIYASCLDGMQKNYLRSIVFVLSFIVLLSCSYFWVPVYGLLGVAYAQLAQAVFLLVMMVSGLKSVFRQHKVFAFRWDKDISKKIFSFGIKEQIISICQLCFDPFTKSLLGSFGSLSMVTYYEMANRLVLQLRGLLVNANQVLIPIFTNARENSVEASKSLYKKVFSLNLIMSCLWLSLITAIVIPVSLLWIGSVNYQFVLITILLSVAYFFNIMISPAYFSNMGQAMLKDNVIANLIMAVANISLCYLLGYTSGGAGVVVGWSAALIAGAVYLLITYHKRHHIVWSTVIKKADIAMAALMLLLCVGITVFFYYFPGINIWFMLIAAAVIFILGLVISLRFHPVMKMIFSYTVKKLRLV